VDECNKEELCNKIPLSAKLDEADFANDSDSEQDDVPELIDESRKTNEDGTVKIRESFSNWRKNLIFFINHQECPCDSGAQILENNNKFLN